MQLFRELSVRQIIIWSVLTTAILELITVILRFGFALESQRDTASTIGVLTMGLRIHHGYIGVVLVLAALALRKKLAPGLRHWMIVSGVGLFLSDMVHHFIVLKTVTGSAEFHFFYH